MTPTSAAYFLRLLGATPNAFTSWHDLRISGTYGASAGRAQPPQQDAARQTAAHAGTPTVAHFDALGRTCLTVADNGSAGRYPARIALDTEGKPLAVFDALGRRAMEYVLRVPAGRRSLAVRLRLGPGRQPALPERHGQRSAAQPGQHRRQADPPLGRARPRLPDPATTSASGQTHLYVSTSGAPEILIERSVYGEGHAGAESLRPPVPPLRHRRRRPSTIHYDFKGNLASARPATRLRLPPVTRLVPARRPD